MPKRKKKTQKIKPPQHKKPNRSKQPPQPKFWTPPDKKTKEIAKKESIQKLQANREKARKKISKRSGKRRQVNFSKNFVLTLFRMF